MKSVCLKPRELPELHQHIKSLIAEKQFAGCAWKITLAGEIIDQGVTGFQDHGASVPLASNTIYRLYSMTKPVIAFCCLQLIQRGLLSINDPIEKWIPDFTSQRVEQPDGLLVDRDRSITIEDLLTHRAGLSYDFLPDCRVASRYRDAKLAEDGTRSLSTLVEILAELPLACQPATRWYYSYSTDVLAHLVERVMDMPLAHALKSLLFDHLGLTDTAFHVPAAHRHRLADMLGQRLLGDVPDDTLTSNQWRKLNVESSYPSNAPDQFTRGGIGLYSTLDDYQQLLDVFKTGKSQSGDDLLDEQALNTAWKNHLSETQWPIAIGSHVFDGYGWGLLGRVRLDSPHQFPASAEGEGGWAGAASTYFWIDRANDFTGILMTQYLGSAVPLGQDCQNLAYQLLNSATAVDRLS